MSRPITLSLPDDLRTLLGEETLAAVLDEEEFGMRSRSTDVDSAFRTAEALLGPTTGDEQRSMLRLRRLDDGIAVGTSPDAVEALSQEGRALGTSPAFRTAVPDAADAGVVMYVDIARAVELSGEDLGEHAQDVRPLQSFGMTSSGHAKSGTFRMRLTVRN